MKKILSLLFLIFVSNLGLMAQEGKATITRWEMLEGSATRTTSSLAITNISSETITIFIKLFDEDGNEYTESVDAGTNFRNIGALTGDPTSVTGATLGPNETGNFVIEKSATYRMGYGEIKWTSNQNIQVAVIASMMNVVSGLTNEKYSRTIYEVNHSNPF